MDRVFLTVFPERNNPIDKESLCETGVIAKSETTEQSHLLVWEIAAGLRPRNHSHMIVQGYNSDSDFELPTERTFPESLLKKLFARGAVWLVMVAALVPLVLFEPGSCAALSVESVDFSTRHWAQDRMREDSGVMRSAPMLASGLLGTRMYELASAPPVIPPAIPPLFTSPSLPGEGIWHWKDMPTGEDGQPIIFKTTYRPSAQYPNAIVHMFLFKMKNIATKLYIGSAEEGGSADSAQIEQQDKPSLLAVTNGLWKLKHSGGGGIIFRGKVVKKLVPGLATIVIHKDQSIDIVEWNDSMPTSEVWDARQLKHLIVSGGQVFESVQRGNRTIDAEIGLGSLLDESQPLQANPQDPSAAKVMNFTSGPDWFIATRSAFGIRDDGNLVFAIGHHISTKDLAKALALAGCVRAIHGDANPGNCTAAIYRMDEKGNLLSLEKLSPQQNDFITKRYVTGSVTSDFYAFFKKVDKEPAQ